MRFYNVTSANSIAERISLIFRDVFDDETINIRDDMTSRDIEAWDSLMHIDLIFALEKEFKIVFTTGEAGSTLQNVGELRTLIEKKIAGRGAG
jgi:acyl carrier protein